jgi:hypothetical protein
MNTSNFEIVKDRYKKIYGDEQIYISDKFPKKYYVINPRNNRKVYFGDIRYEDYTKHTDDKRRDLYLSRALNIKGDWYNNIYSPNYLAIVLLW